jgi:hypothetical protein
MQLTLLILGIAGIVGGATIYWINYKHNMTKARIGLIIECLGLTLAFGKWLVLFVYNLLAKY